MTQTHRTILFAFLLILPGCGDDGSGAGDDAGPFDQCISMADSDLLTTPVADGGVPDPVGIGGVCATVDCFSELLTGTAEEGELCLDNCWAASELGGLSDGCRDCYLDATTCAGLLCISDCINGGPNCLPCIELNCLPRQDDCAGI